MRRIWELEYIPTKAFLSTEQQFCEEHFNQTVSRTINGRYIVEMPILADKPKLGPSRDIAVKWLMRMEKSLLTKPKERRLYHEFMEQYITLGHMRQVNKSLIIHDQVYYTPHHFVTKRDGNEAKFRVVFNASSKTANGIALNDGTNYMSNFI